MQFTDEFFDRGIDRLGTDAVKWEEARTPDGRQAIPMWVADMDFPSPPAVLKALQDRVARGTFGYTLVTERLLDTVCDFWHRRHRVALQPAMLQTLPSVVSGLKLALRTVTSPGDQVIILTPLYGPFEDSIRLTGRKMVRCPLLRDENGRCAMDLDAVEKALQAGAKTLMLCNPHNPVSRLWRREELEALIRLLDRYGAFLISDEIHADFALEGSFTSALSITQERLIVLLAPSKTFNLAGLQTAFSATPDAALRKRLEAEKDALGMESGNLLGLTAAEAAYREGDAWLDGLLHYLRGNRDALQAALAAALPRGRLTPLEATYLGWLDVSPLGMDGDEAAERALAAGVRFSPGSSYGEEGKSCLRINIGCPRRQLNEAIRLLGQALAD